MIREEDMICFEEQKYTLHEISKFGPWKIDIEIANSRLFLATMPYAVSGV